MKYITTVGDEKFEIEINNENAITVNGEVIHADMLQTLDSTIYSMLLEGESHDIRMHEGDGVYEVQMGGELYEVVVEDERTRRLAGLRKGGAGASGEIVIKAPMPGVVVAVPVSEGQEVAKGEIVVILESMKMQNEFKAPQAGTVKAIKVSAGDKIDQKAVMVTLVGEE